MDARTSHTLALSLVLPLLLAGNTVTLARLIDLSHVQGPRTFMSPGNDPYRHKVVYSGNVVPGVYAEYGKIAIGEHGGTHLDAPLHFDKDGTALHEIPLKHTILDGVMIDVSKDVKGNINYVMPLSKLHDYEKEHGEIPKGAGIVINFGWSHRIGDTFQYVGTRDLSDLSTYKYPSLSKEAGDWLYNARDARLLATDTMSPDLVKDKLPIHVTFLKNKRLIVENVNNAGSLPPRGFRLHATPVKYLGASGTQVRLYAMTYDEDNHHHGNGQQRSTCLPASFLLVVCLILHIMKLFNY